MSPEKNRVDLYTVIHKGIRAMLFDLAASAARLDCERAPDVDLFVSRVERALGFLEEHAEKEDKNLLPVLQTIAPEVEATLAAEHHALDALQERVAAAAYALATAEPSGQSSAAAHLCRLINQLTSAHLGHMNREETEANQALWAAFDDLQLMAIQARIIGSITPVRLAEWMEFVIPALNPVERRVMSAHRPPAPATP
jgi:hypothetical protein